MQPIMIIQKLALTKSKPAQSKIISDAWESDSEEFFLGLEMALDPNLNFHVVSVPEIQDPDDGDVGTFSFNDFLILSRSLANGNLKGDVVENLLIEAAQKANISEWNLWYRRILLKTLANSLPLDIIRSTLSRLTMAQPMLS